MLAEGCGAWPNQGCGQIGTFRPLPKKEPLMTTRRLVIQLSLITFLSIVIVPLYLSANRSARALDHVPVPISPDDLTQALLRAGFAPDWLTVAGVSLSSTS